MSATDPCELPADRKRGSTFGWSLGVVLRRWHEYVEEVLDDLPHGSRGYHILAVVVHEDVPTQGALATRLAIDRSVLTYVIDDLENAGLIERRLDPQDRRARRVVATDRGRAALAEAERRVAHAEDHVLGGLPEDQRDTFRDFAARAADAIHAAAPATDPCVAVRSVLPPTEHGAG
ncbi:MULTISPECIES: MarR family transcriptional regulator [unclassified Micromonospora]|uniref:MarR family winged helix-turn-helix transcriptional regulator n=1 Tax=unclassified Micromonospora TaxID=2617518 RepID=UPI00249B9791|nr:MULTISPECIES: MarR family transcriptional regulator [unclassified Micromonospora]WFE53457.1 MarR family transcriptional regulator [Micromonospora sp. WMMD1155]WFE99986.1 MarR family transcriptional regulator [Micromonospora sp. WMMD964]